MAASEDMQSKMRLGVVSFLNAKPLIAGLESNPDVLLRFDVPSRLPDLLDGGDLDAALVPVIDLVRSGRQWRIVSDACIGCDGETLTVRVFSRCRPEEVTRLHVDGDSHTSVALARIIWQECYGCKLDVLQYDGTESVDECEAVLLIGDKVVNHTLIDYDIETDLGSAWKSLTGLPFVFAVWAAGPAVDADRLSRLLNQARDRGVASAELIAEDFGPGMGWPVALAKRYLGKRLRFHLGERHQKGMARFLHFADKYGLADVGAELVYA